MLKVEQKQKEREKLSEQGWVDLHGAGLQQRLKVSAPWAYSITYLLFIPSSVCLPVKSICSSFHLSAHPSVHLSNLSLLIITFTGLPAGIGITDKNLHF